MQQTGNERFPYPEANSVHQAYHMTNGASVTAQEPFEQPCSPVVEAADQRSVEAGNGMTTLPGLLTVDKLMYDLYEQGAFGRVGQHRYGVGQHVRPANTVAAAASR